MDLTKVCQEINPTEFNISCSSGITVGYPKKILYGFQGATIAAVGEYPTAAEVQTAIDGGNFILIPVTNGKWTAPEMQTLSAELTYAEVEKVIRETNGVTGELHVINNEILQVLAQNNLNNEYAQVWIIDSENNFWGATEGYLSSFHIPSPQHDGRNAEAFIAIEQKWDKPKTKYLPISTSDSAYNALTNNSGVYTETVVTTYVEGQVTGYEGITGWAKATYPTLYFKIDTNVISIYTSAADRTGATNEVATIDSTDSLTVVEANASGFGGALTFIANDIVDASEWNVTYSQS